jgi:hypothetical protein
MSLVIVEEVLREYATEAAAAEDNKVKGASIGSVALLGTAQGFIETVARESAQHVTSEIRELGVWTGCHESPSFMRTGLTGKGEPTVL